MSDARLAPSTTLGRRDLIRLAGLTISFGALVAACGDDRGGDTDPGRIGEAPPITDPPTYPVDDAVLLRTLASIENSTAAVHEAVLAVGVLDAEGTTLVEQLLAGHRSAANAMNTLAVEAGGEAWTCGNPWLDERLLEPVVALIGESDDQARDVYNVAVSLENLAVSSYQQLATEFTEPDFRRAAAVGAAQSSRNSAMIVVTFAGPDFYVNPTLLGEDVQPNAEGFLPQYAIPFRFGSIEQFELTVGPPLVNGRESFVIQTPAENSYVYNELELTC